MNSRIAACCLALSCLAVLPAPTAYAYVDDKQEDKNPEPVDNSIPLLGPNVPTIASIRLKNTEYKAKPIIEVPFHQSAYDAMRQAESSEKRVQNEAAKIEAESPKAHYMAVMFLPSGRTGPMKLGRDPNIYLASVLNEIKELKIPSQRIHSSIEYKFMMRTPRIIVYCYNC